MRMKLDTKGKRNQMVRDKIEKNSVNKMIIKNEDQT
jgi:hypothetical protein